MITVHIWLLKCPCCHLAHNPTAIREAGSVMPSTVSLGLGGMATQLLSDVVPLSSVPSLLGKWDVLWVLLQNIIGW